MYCLMSARSRKASSIAPARAARRDRVVTSSMGEAATHAPQEAGMRHNAGGAVLGRYALASDVRRSQHKRVLVVPQLIQLCQQGIDDADGVGGLGARNSRLPCRSQALDLVDEHADEAVAIVEDLANARKPAHRPHRHHDYT